MINPILSAINERLDSYTKTFCLLERSTDGKTIQYSGGGSFNTIPFDSYKIGGYWRLRSNVSFTEAAGTVACTKKQTITYPLYFVAWFRRDEVEDYDQFAQLTSGTISTLRTPDYRTQVRGYNIDQQQTETGKINNDWMVVRFEVDIVFTKICPTTCATVEPICKLLGSINDVEIGEFFSDFNIIVQDTDGNAVGEWDGSKWVVPASGGSGGDPTIVNIQSVLAGTTPYGDPVNIILRDPDRTDLVAGFTVLSDNPYVVRMDWVNVSVRQSSGVPIIYDQNFINGQSIQLDITNSIGAAIAAVLLGTQIRVSDGTLTIGGVPFPAPKAGESYVLEAVDNDDNPITVVNDGGVLKVPALPCAVPDSVTADFSALPLTPEIEDDVVFTDASTGSPSAPDIWLWGFGDGDYSRLQNPTKKYHIGGSYDVTLFACNDAEGVSDRETKVDYITVDGLAEKYAGYQFGPALFKLHKDQTQCVRLYRPASDTYEIIGFGSDNWIDVEAVETFANGSQVLINRVYHPTDSARDCVQATEALMPTLSDASGNIHRNSAGKPEFRGGGTRRWKITNFDYFPAGDTKLFMQFMGDAQDNGGSQVLINHGDGSPTRGYFFYLRYDSTPDITQWAALWSNDGTNFQLNTTGTLADGLQVSQFQLDMGLASASRLAQWRNNFAQPAAVVSGNEGGHINETTDDIYILNSANGGAPFTGGASAILLFNEDMTADQAALAENAMKVMDINP